MELMRILYRFVIVLNTCRPCKRIVTCDVEKKIIGKTKIIYSFISVNKQANVFINKINMTLFKMGAYCTGKKDEHL